MIDRLATMDVQTRNRLSWALMGIGTIALALGTVWAHYALFPETIVESGVEVVVVVDYLGWIPRGWVSVTAGQLVALGGSQLMLVAAALLWVADKPMTWARAGFLAWLVFIELILIYGVVPSEWLNLAQGPLNWTSQRIFLGYGEDALVRLPEWVSVVTLNNPIEFSLAALKDAVSGTYHIVMLAVNFWFAYIIQDWGKSKPAVATEAQTSPYGRPLVKGDA